jgi:hypothetical protein
MVMHKNRAAMEDSHGRSEGIGKGKEKTKKKLTIVRLISKS